MSVPLAVALMLSCSLWCKRGRESPVRDKRRVCLWVCFLRMMSTLMLSIGYLGDVEVRTIIV